MKLAIMQPYFFPYVGYWQLLQEVDTFVIYDDVNYIKQGYINRNSILNGSDTQRITMEVLGASSNKLINEVIVGSNKRLLKTIQQNYHKAPQFQKVFPLFKTILEFHEKNLAKFLGHSIYQIVDYLDIDVDIIYSSDIEKNNSLKGQDKIIDIAHQLKAREYINAIGGQELYKREVFQKNNIELYFLKTQIVEYTQYDNRFVSHLSIIDVLMFNDRNHIKNILNSYVRV